MQQNITRCRAIQRTASGTTQYCDHVMEYDKTQNTMKCYEIPENALKCIKYYKIL